MLHVALFEPEIPQNTGALLRLAACLDFHLHLIEPLGFVMRTPAMQRAHMDYIQAAACTVHPSWSAFVQTVEGAADFSGRLIGLTPAGTHTLPQTTFQDGDTLLFGAESAGLPDAQQTTCNERVRIPMVAGQRSLNLALSVALTVGYALHDMQTWPT
jgi:tRNA (cytidine/uridine-2'-O-)-methyltransferase